MIRLNSFYLHLPLKGAKKSPTLWPLQPRNSPSKPPRPWGKQKYRTPLLRFAWAITLKQCTRWVLKPSMLWEKDSIRLNHWYLANLLWIFLAKTLFGMLEFFPMPPALHVNPEVIEDVSTVYVNLNRHPKNGFTLLRMHNPSGTSKMALGTTFSKKRNWRKK